MKNDHTLISVGQRGDGGDDPLTLVRGLICGNLLDQLAKLIRTSFSAPLFIDVAGHRPHKTVEGVFILQISHGSEELVENILGQVFRILAGRGSGHAISKYGF